MIYTVTCNPSLDYIVRVEHFVPGAVNRTRSEEVLYGGKGVNVSWVLKNLGVESVALGFVAGFTGSEIERGVRAYGCRTDFIRLETGCSRINVKLKSDQESEINGAGPEIPAHALQALFEKLDRLTGGDIVVLAGSIPGSLPPDLYQTMQKRLAGRGVDAVVDATGELLLGSLAYRPFLIKPNHHELGELFDKTLRTPEEIAAHAKRLQEKGARNVLVSMAGDGALLATEDGQTLYSLPPRGKVVNSTGAGDSMVAGFLAGYLETQDYRHAFRMGLAAGSASAFSEQLATKEEVLKLLQTLGA